MKLKEGILTHRVDEDYVTIFTAENPGEFHGVLRSNKEAYFIMECLKEDITREELLRRITERYEGDPEKIEEDIDSVLDNLRETGSLEE